MPSLVVLVGNSLEHLGHVRHLLSAGSVVVLAPTADAARRWLNESLGRAPQERPRQATLRVLDLEVDLGAHRAFWKDAPLPLTELELQILAALAEEPGTAWAFRQLLERAWGRADGGDPGAVRSAVKRLRKKLAQAGVDLRVEAVWGLGFRLAVPRGRGDR